MPRKKASRRKPTRRKRKAARKSELPKNWRPSEIAPVEPSGLGPEAAGQSGDIEGLPTTATGDSESVEELVEEGQDLEAEKVRAVENAPEPDQGEVRTHHRRR